MKVAADIGTAKVMGAIDTSFMNEKNDTAIAQVETITIQLRAIARQRPDSARAEVADLAVMPHAERPEDVAHGGRETMHITTRIHFIAGCRPAGRRARCGPLGDSGGDQDDTGPPRG
jgi:hypothetical protein